MRTRFSFPAIVIVGLLSLPASRSAAGSSLDGLLSGGCADTVSCAGCEPSCCDGEPLAGALGCTDEAAGCCDIANECDSPRWYVSGIVGASFATLASGGVNTAEGGFQNVGSANDTLFTAGGALGRAFARTGGQLRVEVEGRGRDLLTGTTQGFQPPVPTSNYDVRAADGWLVTANLWRDFYLTDRLGAYGGGGIGGGGYRLSVNDGFVSGYSHVGGFAWQAGGGVFYQVNRRITLDLGYRFFEIGRTSVPLTTISTLAPSGSYTSMFSTSELLLSVRVYEPFARWRR
jgi:opacity protein-like surface antigen